MIAFVNLAGGNTPHWTATAGLLIEAAGFIGAITWTTHLLTTRKNVGLPMRSPVWISVPLIAALLFAVDEHGLLSADGQPTRSVGLLAQLAVWVMLAAEIRARAGDGSGGDQWAIRSRERQWATAWFVGFSYAACLIACMLLWRWLALLPGPVLHSSQAVAAGAPTLGAHLALGIWSGVVEELLVTATAATVLAAARRPAWECVAASVLMRVLPHAYVGWPMAAGIPLGAAAVFLFLRYRKAAPLVIAHVAYNVITTLMVVPLVAALLLSLLLAGITGIWMATGDRHRLSKVQQPARQDPAGSAVDWQAQRGR
ncbi:type II CAAX prenyl endopeptidase Rce1 family protein [Streptomyces sp. NPDC014735]|uniref:CPBP family glutamic-type intramembrane protease n=1 Tax=Streptomyces sp. NPDC014735 TaxID=3364887 RepID=UPI003702864D